MTAVATGLDYTAVETVMRVNGVQDQADALSKIQLIERGALEAFADKRDEE